MTTEEQRAFWDPPSSGRTRPDWLGLCIDNRRLLEALQDGWLKPVQKDSGSLVGVERYMCDAEEPEGNRIPVRIQVDASDLPNIEVLTLREDRWKKMNLSDAVASDTAVFWPGPLPLFSNIKLCVSSEERRARLMNMGKRTLNVELPNVLVCGDAQQVLRPDMQSEMSASGITIPESHDAVRGAISMALWAVPGVDPWLNLLTASLAARAEDLSEFAKAVDAGWWRFPPWMRTKDAAPLGAQECLWLAASDVFATPSRKDLRDTVDNIAATAKQGENDSNTRLIEDWQTVTHQILSGKAMIRLDEWREHPVGLAIQLVLTRPEPTEFKTWYGDNPTRLSPVVLFSGATLCGLLHGYRNLSTRFRGDEAQRAAVAVESLRLCSTDTDVRWPGMTCDPPKWHRKKGEFTMSWGGKEFTLKPEKARGRWYAADLEIEENQSEALKITKGNDWRCHRRVLAFGEGRRHILGSGIFQSRPRSIDTRGDVHVELLPGDQLQESLDADGFRRLIALEPGRFTSPPALRTEARRRDRSNIVPGLTVIPDFISESEERNILEEIERADWSTELKRRVQHYGWRYDYKSRQIDTANRMEPLPDWAQVIAQRLVGESFFREGLPDQVIVNEYIGDQGIAPHVDSPDSFSGTIAMVSLLESWEMDFQRPGEKDKVALRLDRRSATILEGEARFKWKHGIRGRKSDPGPVKPGNNSASRIPRGRRVSLTYRKVIHTTQQSDNDCQTARQPDPPSLQASQCS